MLPIIILGALTAHTGAPDAPVTTPCPPAAIVVVHWSQPTPCDLDGTQTLVLVDTDHTTADQVGGLYLGYGITWSADY
jgi:hypothetical protein